MQAEACDAGAAWTGQSIHALGIDLIPDSGDAASGIRPKSHPARHSGVLKFASHAYNGTVMGLRISAYDFGG